MPQVHPFIYMEGIGVIEAGVQSHKESQANDGNQ
jgi:hypothetical protein